MNSIVLGSVSASISRWLGVGGMRFCIGASEQGPGAVKQHTDGYRTGENDHNNLRLRIDRNLFN